MNSGTYHNNIQSSPDKNSQPPSKPYGRNTSTSNYSPISKNLVTEKSFKKGDSKSSSPVKDQYPENYTNPESKSGLEASISLAQSRKVLLIRNQKAFLNNNKHSSPQDTETALVTSNGLSFVSQDQSPHLKVSQRSELPSERERFVDRPLSSSQYWNLTEVENLGNGSAVCEGMDNDKWVTDQFHLEGEQAERAWKQEEVAQNKILKTRNRPEVSGNENNCFFDDNRRSIRRGDSNTGLMMVREAENEVNMEPDIHIGYGNLRALGNARQELRPRAQLGIIEELGLARAQSDNIVNDLPSSDVEIRPDTQRPMLSSQPQPVSQTQIQAQAQARTVTLQEAEFFLERCLIFFFAVAMASLFIKLVIEYDLPYWLIFIPCYGYLICLTFEKFLKVIFAKEEPLKRREDYFNMADTLGGILFFALINLRLSGASVLSIGSSVPFLVSLLLYTTTSKAPPSLKNHKIFFRWLYTIQSFMICAKVDNIIDWDWRFVFVITWLFLFIIGIYFLSFVLILSLAIVFALLRQRLFENISMLHQVAGMLWSVLYYGEGALLFMGILGFSKAYQDQDGFELLIFAAEISFGVNAFLLVYTLLGFRSLATFIEVFNRIQQPANLAQVQDSKAPTVRLEVERKESYFVMLSSTYFSPLDGNFFRSNKEKLINIKDRIIGFRLWKPQKQVSESMQEDSPGEAVDIEVLKQYKQVLDEKLTRIGSLEISRAGSLESARLRKSKSKELKRDNTTKGKQIEKNVSSKLGTAVSSQRLNLSADDVNIKEVAQHTGHMEGNSNEDKVCYLCYDNPPDAVLMNCGHGGICYSCANLLVQKKNECMECRCPINIIYRIDPNPKLADIIKGVELCKVQSQDQ